MRWVAQNKIGHGGSPYQCNKSGTARRRWQHHWHIGREGYGLRNLRRNRKIIWANSSPINTSSLRHSVGFCASTEFTKDLLQQKIPILREPNEHTIMLIKEMQCLYAWLQPLHSPTMVTPEIYRYYWGCINKSTLSAWSKIHLGYCKAICKSEELSKLICNQLNLVAATGTPPSRWGTGLQILLKKVPGVAVVDKLQAIILMEGNFNFLNKCFLGTKRSTSCTKMGMFQTINAGRSAAQGKTPNWITV
jgi:hypothetical protein